MTITIWVIFSINYLPDLKTASHHKIYKIAHTSQSWFTLPAGKHV